MPSERSPLALRAALAMTLAISCTTGSAWSQTVPSSEAARRGYQLLLARQESGCVLCHRITGLPVGGDIGPSLQGLAARSSAQGVRARIADPKRFNPDTLMPAYFSVIGLNNVATPYRGKTVLTEQGLDDIVAYLMQADRAGP